MRPWILVCGRVYRPLCPRISAGTIIGLSEWVGTRLPCVDEWIWDYGELNPFLQTRFSMSRSPLDGLAP